MTSKDVDFQSTATDKENCQVEFDELMRSGTTMKVSLTPDRLRTFDVRSCYYYYYYYISGQC